MITYVDSNLFESPAKVLVNTVNTVGVMGKGIAKTFKEVYPEMFKQYQSFCRDGSLTVGKLWLYKTSHKWILNFPTKEHWRAKSKLEYIEAGLQKFADTYDRKLLLQVSFPMLGCGNGELDWDDVRPLMEEYLRPLPIDVYIHLYRQAKDFVPERLDVEGMNQWLRTNPQVLPFTEFVDDLSKVLGTGTSLRTLDDMEKFTASATSSPPSLQVTSGNYEFSLQREDLEMLWGNMRLEGFYSEDTWADLSPFQVPYVSAILNQLSYITNVTAKDRYESADYVNLLTHIGMRRRGHGRALKLIAV